MATTYAYYHRVLRLLQSHRPPHRWLVKAPYHNFHLAELAAEYPDARFLMTHRDPAATVPSACSTVASAQRAVFPRHEVDPVSLGAFLLEHLVDGIGRAMASRRQIGEHRFLDIQQHELDSDAMAAVERIYDFLGFESDDGARTGAAAWLEANHRGSRGVHAYDAEEYGLTVPGIRKAFAEYIDAYGVRCDGAEQRSGP
jgi:hypothetical protein